MALYGMGPRVHAKISRQKRAFVGVVSIMAKLLVRECRPAAPIATPMISSLQRADAWSTYYIQFFDA